MMLGINTQGNLFVGPFAPLASRTQPPGARQPASGAASPLLGSERVVSLCHMRESREV